MTLLDLVLYGLVAYGLFILGCVLVPLGMVFLERLRR